ncbi:F-box/LRR-repeat protein 4 [Anopheles nili]|uniref:F-box/LRR-repeat protein 4 n=1 Tax=Anopheles nili TaxID=185578 RepID=UPI00237A5CE9|nr:F-box/LRR-repeat protein 4 [Anopheles nili]
MLALRKLSSLSQRASVADELKQYGGNIIHASNQYGSTMSISYAAVNFTGQPRNFPNYGDYQDTYLLTTYGNWWREVPSFSPEFGCKNISLEDDPPIDDFVVLSFENVVYPTALDIFETFHPGAIQRIWAFTFSRKWILLWNVEVDRLQKQKAFQQIGDGKSRLFHPLIRPMDERTRVLRIEFSTRHLDYLPGLDGVMLTGSIYPTDDNQFCRQSTSTTETKTLGKEIDTPENVLNVCEFPYEILFNIFSNLDLLSLRTAEKVCKKFRDVVQDSHLYREVNFRPYWMEVNSEMIAWLSDRCSQIRKLDLSWCGMFGFLKDDDVSSFLRIHGSELTNLRLNSTFIAENSFRCLSTHCRNLRELSIRNASFTNHLRDGFFQHLVRLDIARSDMSTKTLVCILRANPCMQHLNASCCEEINMQEIAMVISVHNLDLVSLNTWKTQTLHTAGLLALKNCTKLQELDLGWSIHDESLEGVLENVVKNCPGLQKLVLSGIRSVQNADMVAIAEHCPDLTQLDVMGCIRITGQAVQAVLMSCRKLRLLEISHCSDLEPLSIGLWKRDYPQVAIKHFTDIY